VTVGTRVRIDCFKAYDLRGRVPDELNADVAYRVGYAYAQFLDASRVVIGRDVRQSGPSLCAALTRGLQDSGVEVSDIGVCGTEEIYFATWHGGFDGGIAVTASHNPPEYNGMKMVGAGARPISSDTGLVEIRAMAESLPESQPGSSDAAVPLDLSTAYIDHLLAYVDPDQMSPLKLVVNAGNGGAGPVFDALAECLPVTVHRLQHDADGSFPNGVPNPLLVENRDLTAIAVREQGADLGIAWDGDFDRCFFFDADGRFVEGYYLVGLLAERFLGQRPGATIVHDPRLVWNTLEIVARHGGQAVQSKSGHAFIKQRMRQVDAVYGGEMSAHHYFKDFSFCDSGMIPWLLVADVMSRSGRSLAELVDERIGLFPCSGEINRTVEDADRVLAAIERRYRDAAQAIDLSDGVSIEFADWRFNLRKSNTEPLIRLNLETRGDEAAMRERTAELVELIEQF
jgi:phosphomannomutase